MRKYRGSHDASLIRRAREAICRHDSGAPCVVRDSPTEQVTIEGYDLIREIGRGGQGIVYQAVQRSTQRHVAIKVLRHGLLASSSEHGRLAREVCILAQLKHPGIVTIHDSGRSGTLSYLVMDYIEGVPLDTYLAHTRLAMNEQVELFARIAESVNAAHLQGVIHRDLKPANIRVDAGGQPHILDFGVAKLLEEESPFATLTMTGQFVGSLEWSAPEQARGDLVAIDVRTDVYTLGVIFWNALTGSFPYSVEGDMSQVLTNIISVEPTRAGRSGTRMPRDVETILRRCLAKDPARRYQNAGEVAADLRCYLTGKPIAARRDSQFYVARMTIARHRVVFTLAVCVLAVTVGATVMLGLMYKRSERIRREVEDANESLRRGIFAAVPSLGDTRVDFAQPWSDSRFVPAGDVTAQNGRLVVNCTRLPSGSMALVPSQSVLRGDFDIQVDYALEDDSELLQGAIQILLRLHNVRAGTWATWISRYREHNPQCPGWTEEEYSSGGTGFCPPAHAATTDHAGKLRISRRGTTATTYYWTNEWRTLHEEPITDDVVGFEINAHRILTDHPFIATFDNLTVTTVFSDERTCLDELLDEFSGNVIDPRLVLQQVMGSPHEAGGTLRMTKLNGYEGGTGCTLDPDRFRLCGNFDLRVDFLLVEWPVFETGCHFVRFGVFDIESRRLIAAVERRRSVDGNGSISDEFCGSIGSEAARSPSDVRAGQLFVRRNEEGLTVGYHDGEDRSLATLLGLESDLFFQLSTGATDKSTQHVVHFDNLRYRPR